MNSADWFTIAGAAAGFVGVVFSIYYAYRNLRESSYRQLSLLRENQKSESRQQDILTSDISRLSDRLESVISFLPSIFSAADELERVSMQLRMTLSSFDEVSNDIRHRPPSRLPSPPPTVALSKSAYQHAAAQYSHSIKTPLSAIESAIADAEVYISRRHSSEVDSADSLHDLVKGSLAGARRAIQAIKDILQTGAGLVGAEKPEELSVSQVVHQAERMSRAATKSTTPVNYELDELLSVRFQKSSVLIPLTLLLENAFEAAKRPDDSIKISGGYEEPTNVVRIIVTNTGPSIPADLRTKLFHEQVSTKKGPGRGTGLLVAQEWLSHVDGHIDLIGSVQDQTDFQLTFRPNQE